MSSRLQLDMRNLSLGRRHLVNAYEVEAGIGVIAGNTVWSMPERLECEVLQKAHYINTLTFYLFVEPYTKFCSNYVCTLCCFREFYKICTQFLCPTHWTPWYKKTTTLGLLWGCKSLPIHLGSVTDGYKLCSAYQNCQSCILHAMRSLTNI